MDAIYCKEHLMSCCILNIIFLFSWNDLPQHIQFNCRDIRRYLYRPLEDGGLLHHSFNALDKFLYKVYEVSNLYKQAYSQPVCTRRSVIPGERYLLAFLKCQFQYLGCSIHPSRSTICTLSSFIHSADWLMAPYEQKQSHQWLSWAVKWKQKRKNVNINIHLNISSLLTV